MAFGQTAHLSVILRNTNLRLDDFLTLHGRPSRGEMHAGLLIDDFVLWEQVGFDTDLEQPTAGSMLVEEVRAAYLKVGLPRHPGKAVSKSPFGEFLGVIRPNLKRLILLAHILCRVYSQVWSQLGGFVRNFDRVTRFSIPTSTADDVHAA